MRNASFIKRSATLALACAGLFGLLANAQPAARFKNMREALNALKSTNNVRDADEIRANLAKVPIEDHDDLMALYDEARKQEDALPLVADDKVYDEQARRSAVLDSRLKTVTDPAFKDDIANLIDKEYQDTKREARLPFPKLTTRSHMKAALRYERINALMTAAGNGKNEKARAALWEIIEIAQDDNLGKGAAIALGKIGNPDDLDRLIFMVKRNPKLLLPLGNFGPIAIPRIMKEIDDPSVPQETKSVLSSALVGASSHETISSFLPLLDNKNPLVVRVAADAIGKNIRAEDDALIRGLSKNPNRSVRGAMLVAVEGHAWKDGYAELLIDTVQHDPDYFLRAGAAASLGEHKVSRAIPVLQKVASEDKAGSVRLSAEGALKLIRGQPLIQQ